MRHKRVLRQKGKILAGVGIVSSLSAPAAAMGEDQVNTLVDVVTPDAPTVDDNTAPAVKSFAHDQLLQRVYRLSRIEAKLNGKRLRHGYARKLKTMNTAKLVRKEHTLLHRINQLERRQADEGPSPNPAVSSVLARIAACESSGNPRAIGGGGKYRGAYQFDAGTWASVGGHGDPAQASMAEQTRRAAILYSRVGASAWPVCGR